MHLRYLIKEDSQSLSRIQGKLPKAVMGVGRVLPLATKNKVANQGDEEPKGEITVSPFFF